MEPNNIENQIREKLNAREIQPTSQAWDRLDAMLSVAEEKKTKRSFGWLYIAASILVFVTVGMFLYNQNKSDIKINESVVSNEETKDTTKVISTSSKTRSKENEAPITQSQPLVQIEENHSKTNQQATNKRSNVNQNRVSIINPSKNNQNEKQANNQKSEEAIAFSPKKEETSSSPKTVIVNSDTNFNEQSKQTTVAANETVSKKESDSKVKVNANSLLSQVDGELDLTFREKVFKKVSKNYKEVKVALANRNLEQ